MIPISQKIISVIWPSFLMAGLGAILFFSAIDPVEMTSPAWFVNLSRLEAYTVGFVFLWVLGIFACFLTRYFQKPEQRIYAKAPGCAERVI